MKKTILLTGGLGYIGSVTAQLLHELDYDIVIIDKLVHKQTFSPSWARIIKGDVGNKAVLRALFREYEFDAVMHFAGLIEVGQSVIRPELFYDNNVAQSLILLETMRMHNVKKIIFSSSCAVYGNPLYVPMDEKHPFAPLSPYGKTKLAVEYMLQDFARAFDFSYVALRYFNAAGAVPEHNIGECHNPETHVLPLLLRAMLLRETFTIFGDDYDTFDGTCVRDYVHVHDIARAHVQALGHISCGGTSDAFNLGSGTGYSVRQLVGVAQDVCKQKLITETVKRRPGDVSTLVAQSGKALEVLGWKPERSDLQTIIRDAWIWEQQRCKHIAKRTVKTQTATAS